MDAAKAQGRRGVPPISASLVRPCLTLGFAAQTTTVTKELESAPLPIAQTAPAQTWFTAPMSSPIAAIAVDRRSKARRFALE